MILVFDTETTTFPSSNLPANHPDQARIVQLAWILLDEDFQERSCFNSLIRIPDSVRISEGAAKAHGISEADCRKYGCSVEYAMNMFFENKQKCKTIVAHNIKFDNQLICIEDSILFGPVTSKNIKDKPEFCTMEAMTNICCLPFRTGQRSFGKKYKWPTLQEAHSHAFGQEFEGAHDALADVRATARIYKWLQTREKVVNRMAPVVPPLPTEQYDTKIA